MTGSGPEASSEPDGAVRLWRLRGTADSPAPPPGQDIWAVWRHRHGYMKTPAGYRWNSLRDHQEAMDSVLGERCDSLLQAAWKHWAAKPGGAEVPGTGRVEVDLAVPGPAAFSLSLWGAALEVRLDIAQGKGDWRYDLAAPPRWTLDEPEWRRRHLQGPDPAFDDLMRRCAAYWATATAHLLLQDLDAQLR
ncbi:MAG: hypothetical protein FD126_57 [Elusimicrobia bacterium]|nr:MAG: hypothetical protein FD126_57 [Elusimicrobiota bacterium]